MPFLRLTQTCNFWANRTTPSTKLQMLPESEAQELVMKPPTKKKRFYRTDSCGSADGTLSSKWLKSVLPLIQGTMFFERLFRRTWTSVSTEDPRHFSPRAEIRTWCLGCVVGANTLSLHKPFWTSNDSLSSWSPNYRVACRLSAALAARNTSVCTLHGHTRSRLHKLTEFIVPRLAARITESVPLFRRLQLSSHWNRWDYRHVTKFQKLFLPDCFCSTSVPITEVIGCITW